MSSEKREDFIDIICDKSNSCSILLQVIKEALSSNNTPIINLLKFLKLKNNDIINTDDYTDVTIIGFDPIMMTNSNFVLQTLKHGMTKHIENVEIYSKFLVIGEGLELFKTDKEFIIKLGEHITITKRDNEFIYEDFTISSNDYTPIRFSGSSIFQIKNRWYNTLQFNRIKVEYCMVYVSIILRLEY